jgi:TorA maturation chaperone TorD
MATRTKNDRSFEAEFASLTQQVANIENDYRDLKMVVVSLDKKIDKNAENLNTKIEAAFQTLAAKLDIQATFPWNSLWAALGVLLIGISTVGYLARQPILDDLAELKTQQTNEITARKAEDIRIYDRLDKTQSSVDFLRGYISAQTGKSIP